MRTAYWTYVCALLSCLYTQFIILKWTCNANCEELPERANQLLADIKNFTKTLITCRLVLLFYQNGCILTEEGDMTTFSCYTTSTHFEIIKNKCFFTEYSQIKKKVHFPYLEITILVLGQTVEQYGTLMVQSTILMGHIVRRISMVTTHLWKCRSFTNVTGPGTCTEDKKKKLYNFLSTQLSFEIASTLHHRHDALNEDVYQLYYLHSGYLHSAWYYHAKQKFSAFLESFPLNFIQSITTAFVGILNTVWMNNHCVE
jgi:hypothetical protein